jgi:hypothetical protein
MKTAKTAKTKAVKTAKIEVTEVPKPIFEYIQRRKGGKNIKVGVIVGLVDRGNTIKIGWSKCNIAKDVFAKHTGLLMATNRALDKEEKFVPAPNCIHRQLRQFGGRCLRFYKDSNILVMPN